MHRRLAPICIAIALVAVIFPLSVHSTGAQIPALTPTATPTAVPTATPAPRQVILSPRPSFSSAGVAVAVFTGITVDDLESITKVAGATGVWVQDPAGGYHLLIVDGPAFLKTDFAAAIPVPIGTIAVTLIGGTPAPPPAPKPLLTVTAKAALPSTTFFGFFNYCVATATLGAGGVTIQGPSICADALSGFPGVPCWEQVVVGAYLPDCWPRR